MINDWKKFLIAQGFEKSGRRDFSRYSAPVSSTLYEIPLGVGHREVRIRIGVEIHDPWILERDYDPIHLSGDITSDGIYVHYEQIPYWLHPDEKEPVYTLISQCAMGWIEYWSNPHHLIEYLENPVDIVMTRPGINGKSCEHVKGVSVKKRLAPATDYNLALLYYHTGDFQKSLAAAERYFRFVERGIRLEDEPQRTRRQIQEIKSKVQADQK